MSTIVLRSVKGSALTFAEGDANFTNLNTDKIESVQQDTAPSLGGNLDVNGFGIVNTTGSGDIALNSDTLMLGLGQDPEGVVITTQGALDLVLDTNDGIDTGEIRIETGASGNIVLEPTGTGKIVLAGLAWPTAPAAGAGFSGNVTSVNGDTNRLFVSNAQDISLGDEITFAGGDVVDAGLESGVTYFVIFADDINGFIEISETAGGSIKNLTTLSMPGDFTWNTSSGASSFTGGEVLTYSNSVNGLVWETASGGAPPPANLNSLTDVNAPAPLNGDLLVYNNASNQWESQAPAGGIANVVDDTTPQLGGALDVNSQSIVSVSNGNIVLAPNGVGRTVTNRLNYNEAIHDLGTVSGTVALNVTNGNVQTITLNGNLTLNAFTSPVAGQSVTLIIETNGTGRTLTSSWLFAGGDKTISTTLTTDIISVFYDGEYYYASLSKGFA